MILSGVLYMYVCMYVYIYIYIYIYTYIHIAHSLHYYTQISLFLGKKFNGIKVEPWEYVLINMGPVNLLPAKLKRTICGIFLETFLASISLRKY